MNSGNANANFMEEINFFLKICIFFSFFVFMKMGGGGGIQQQYRTLTNDFKKESYPNAFFI